MSDTIQDSEVKDNSQPLNPPPHDTARTIREIITSPEFVKALAGAREIRDVKRPPHVSKLGNYSYFREQFGLEMKIVIDRMIETKRNMEWKFADYPELRPKTLYLRINQSLKYLFHCLDPDGYYAPFREQLVVERQPTGWALCWIRDKLNGRAFMPTEMIPENLIEQYKEQIDEFLNDEKVGVLHLKKLNLTTEEQETLKESFIGLEETIAPLITDREVKIVKLNWRKPE